MGGNREESLSLVSYPISIKYNRRFDNFSVFLLWSLESRDFRSRVVMSVKSKQGNTLISGSIEA